MQLWIKRKCRRPRSIPDVLLIGQENEVDVATEESNLRNRGISRCGGSCAALKAPRRKTRCHINIVTAPQENIKSKNSIQREGNGEERFVKKQEISAILLLQPMIFVFAGTRRQLLQVRDAGHERSDLIFEPETVCSIPQHVLICNNTT